MIGAFEIPGAWYDALYADKPYARELRFVLQRLRKHKARFDFALELGCGTGAYTEQLARACGKVMALDCSRAMVDEARRKQSQLPTALAPRIEYRTGDLRSFKCREQFDLVVSLFHVMSYQTTQRDLKKAFATASRLLKPGGLFFFDFWSGPGVLNDPPVKRRKRVSGHGFFLCRDATPELMADRNLVRVRYEFTCRTEGKAVQRATEEHWMRYLFPPEIESLCVASDLKLLECAEWQTGRPVSLRAWNAYAVTRKSRD